MHSNYQIAAAWHQDHVSNGPPVVIVNSIKRVTHAAFGFTSSRNSRIRSLTYAGKPNWYLLATVTPTELRSPRNRPAFH